MIIVSYIRIQEGKNDKQKIEKSEEISRFKVLDVSLLCGLDLFHETVGKKFTIFDQNKNIFQL